MAGGIERRPPNPIESLLVNVILLLLLASKCFYGVLQLSHWGICIFLACDDFDFIDIEEAIELYNGKI